MELNATVRKIREDEVEITFESWDSKYKQTWRMVRRHDHFDIARPGYGSFQRAYDWMFRIPLRCWKKTVANIIHDNLVGCGKGAGVMDMEEQDLTPIQATWIRAREHYVEAVAELLISAKREM